MKSIFKNYIFMYISIFLPKLLSFLILTPFLSKTLGLIGSGITSYTHDIINWAVLIATFGISVYGNKKIAECRNNKNEMIKNFSTILFLQIISHIIILIIYMFLILFVSNEYKVLLLLFSIYLIFDSIDIGWFFSGNEDFKNLSIKNLIYYLIMFIIMLLTIKNSNDTIQYIIAICVAKVISSIYVIIIFFKKYKIKNFKIDNLNTHLNNTFVFFIPELFLSIYTIFDQILLGFMTNPNNVALYGRAESYIKLGVQMITIFSTVFLPRFANLHNKNIKQEKQYFNKILDFLLMLSIPLSFGFIATAKSFISWYLPQEFHEVVYLIISLAPSVIFMVIGNICGTYLMASDKIKSYTKGLFLGAFVNIIINLFLIRLIGPYGAVVSTIFSETIVCLYLIFQVKKCNILSISKINILKYFISSIIMFTIVSFISYVLNDNPISTVIEVIIGILVYFLLIFLQKKSLVEN